MVLKLYVSPGIKESRLPTHSSSNDLHIVMSWILLRLFLRSFVALVERDVDMSGEIRRNMSLGFFMRISKHLPTVWKLHYYSGLMLILAERYQPLNRDYPDWKSFPKIEAECVSVGLYVCHPAAAAAMRKKWRKYPYMGCLEGSLGNP